MSKNEILALLGDYKNKSTEKYGILALGLFGSAARDEERDDSDVDVVVKMKKPDLFFMVHIKDELERILRSQVDIIAYGASMNPYLKNRIDKEACYV
ncbi:MAG: nucleotidyltransferase domain-containing protein [Thermoguttaceae bacterium]|jgi:predicted nucleotidyltransferase